MYIYILKKYIKNMEKNEKEFINPPVNIYEDDNYYYYKIIAPGLDKSELDITILDDVHMVVSGNYRAHIEDVRFPQAPSYVQPSISKKEINVEFPLESFSRNIELYDDVDIEKINSFYDRGVLYITISKISTMKEVTTRKIQIFDSSGVSGCSGT